MRTLEVIAAVCGWFLAVLFASLACLAKVAFFVLIILACTHLIWGWP